MTPQNAGRGGNYETDEFAVDDVVLYTYSSKSGDVGVQSVVTAEQVTGTLTGYTGGESVTVDGKTYEFNAAASISNDTLQGAVKNEVTPDPGYLRLCGRCGYRGCFHQLCCGAEV